MAASMLFIAGGSTSAFAVAGLWCATQRIRVAMSVYWACMVMITIVTSLLTSIPYLFA